MSETRHNGLYWEHEVGNGVKAAVSFAGGEWQAYVIVSKRDGSLLKFSHVGGSKLERDGGRR